jgi:hypothetical protein
MAHINTIIPDTLDPLQFAYLANRSTDDTICIALHTALTHLDKRNTYVRRLFIDYISAFNTIVPSMLITKVRTLGLNISLCNWIQDFQSGCPQVVRVGNNDITVIGLITDNNETSYREEVRVNNLSLNVSKTKELMVDNRKRRAEPHSYRQGCSGGAASPLGMATAWHPTAWHYRG